MQSAWEKLTGGQCNNDHPVNVKKKGLTTRQEKERFKAQAGTVCAKMAKVKALDAIGNNESRKTSKALSNSWDKRVGNNVTGFWVAANQ